MVVPDDEPVGPTTPRQGSVRPISIDHALHAWRQHRVAVGRVLPLKGFQHGAETTRTFSPGCFEDRLRRHRDLDLGAGRDDDQPRRAVLASRRACTRRAASTFGSKPARARQCWRASDA